ncbi:hypothetical protein JXB41_02140 [Candidatus Woesearchaeota archaeon]|nr:hypothetical protein [Candidatus Woesearchaeota archaeon]
MNTKIKIKKRTLLSFCLAIAMLSFALWISLYLPEKGDAYLGAAINQTLNTTVNITNAMPEVRNIVCETPVDLEAYGNVTLNCNTTVFDWDNDTLIVNGTIYQDGSTDADSLLDYNVRYINTSCARLTPQDLEMNYSCTFTIFYYANNGSTWIANITAKDDDDAIHTNLSNYVTINPLVAIYVPGVLDYGEMMTNEISADKLANITNAGNRNVSIYVEGWGAVRGDGLAMNCSYGSIAVSYERYNYSTPGLSWSSQMVQLTNASVLIGDFTVFHRFDDTSLNDSTNSTYWKLAIPPFAGGLCNGKILFTAEDNGV